MSPIDFAAAMATGGAGVWLFFPLAVALGALHALEPGHAKSVMASFIVATRGTASDAVVLGLAAALGHTAVVWAIALTALAMGDDLLEVRLVPWFALGSGLVTLALAVLLYRRARAGQACAHDHGHDHVHAHDHDHGAVRKARTGKPAIAWFGVTGGLAPCPSAVAVLLLCLQLQAFAFGVAMVAAFSLGVAVTMVAVGLVASWGVGRVGGRFDALARWAPMASAALVGAIGVVLTIKGLDLLGVV